MSSLCIDELSPISVNSLNSNFVLTPNLLLHADDSVKSDDLDLSLLVCFSSEDSSPVGDSNLRVQVDQDLGGVVEEGQSTPICGRNDHDVSLVPNSGAFHQQLWNRRFHEEKTGLSLNHELKTHGLSLEMRQLIQCATLPCSPLHEVQDYQPAGVQVAHNITVGSLPVNDALRISIESRGSGSATQHNSPLLEETEPSAENKRETDGFQAYAGHHRESGGKELSVIKSGRKSAESDAEPCHPWKESVTGLGTQSMFSSMLKKRANVADSDTETTNGLKEKESKEKSELYSFKLEDTGNFAESDTKLDIFGTPRQKENLVKSDTKTNSSCIAASKESDIKQEHTESCKREQKNGCLQKRKSVQRRKKSLKRKTFLSESDSDVSVNFKRNRKKCKPGSDDSSIFGFDWESPLPLRRSQRIPKRRFKVDILDSDSESPGPVRKNQRIRVRRRVSSSCSDVEYPTACRKRERVPRKRLCTKYSKTAYSCEDDSSQNRINGTIEKQCAKIHGEEQSCSVEGKSIGKTTPEKKQHEHCFGGGQGSGHASAPQIQLETDCQPHSPTFIPVAHFVYESLAAKSRSTGHEHSSCTSDKFPFHTATASGIEKKLVFHHTDQNVPAKESLSLQQGQTDASNHLRHNSSHSFEMLRQVQPVIESAETHLCLQANHLVEAINPHNGDKEKENTPLNSVKMHIKFNPQTADIDGKAACSVKRGTVHSISDHKNSLGFHEICKRKSSHVAAVGNSDSESNHIQKASHSESEFMSIEKKAYSSNSAECNHEGKSVSKLQLNKAQLVFKITLGNPFDPFYKQKLRQNGSLNTKDTTFQKERINSKDTDEIERKNHKTDQNEGKKSKQTYQKQGKKYRETDQGEKKSKETDQKGKKCKEMDQEGGKKCELMSTKKKMDKIQHKSEDKIQHKAEDKIQHKAEDKIQDKAEDKIQVKAEDNIQLKAEAQSTEPEQPVGNDPWSRHGHYMHYSQHAAVCGKRQKKKSLKDGKGQKSEKKSTVTASSRSEKEETEQASGIKASKIHKRKKRMLDKAYYCSTEEDVPQSSETKANPGTSRIGPLRASLSDPESSSIRRVLCKWIKSEIDDDAKETCNEKQMKRKKAVLGKGVNKSKGSHNRHRGGEEKAYNFITLARAIVTETEAIRFCQDNGLLPQSSQCPQCKGLLNKLYKIVRTVNTASVEFRFQCNRKMCKSRGQLPVRNVQWFSQSGSIMCCQHLLIFYLFSNQFTAEQAVEESVVLSENIELDKVVMHEQVKAVCPETVQELYNFCREVCVLSLPDPEPIGGSNCTVVILEAQFGKMKHCVQRFPYGQFVLGAFCRQTDVVFLVPVPALESEYVIPVIQKYVKKGTEVQTDNSDIYRRLGMLGYKHVALTHAHHDLDPETGRCLKHNKDSIWWMRKDGQRSTRPSFTSTRPPSIATKLLTTSISLHTPNSQAETPSSACSESLGYHSQSSSCLASTPVHGSTQICKKTQKISTPVLESTGNDEDLSEYFDDAHVSNIHQVSLSLSSASLVQREGSFSWNAFDTCADDSRVDNLTTDSAAAASVAEIGSGPPARKVSLNAGGCGDWIFAQHMAEFLWRRIHRDDKDIFLSFLRAVEQVFPVDLV